MYTDDKDLMVKALGQSDPQTDWESQDFAPSRKWDDSYPYKPQEYQHMNPVEHALFYGVPRPELLKMAGDVLPMYIPGTEPADAGKRSMEATAYGWGNKSAPNISSIGLPTMRQWLDNTRLKALGN